MSPFWGKFFEHLQGCGKGRNATLFLVALAGFFGLLFALLVAWHALPTEFRPVTLGAIGLVGLLWALRTVIRLRHLHRTRLRREPLSDDELSKARTKLQRTHRIQ